jgi:hypothetical protein
MRNEHEILIGRHEGKRPLRDKGLYRGIILKRILKVLGQEVVEWILLAEGKLLRWTLVNTVMNLPVQGASIRFSRGFRPMQLVIFCLQHC